MWLINIYLDVSKIRAVGPRNITTIVMRREHFSETYSVSCLCSLDPNMPIYATGREDSNTQLDFFKFLVDAIVERALQPGDILICDNARIHQAQATAGVLGELLDLFNIQLRYLPTYSPELNPCELVFMKLKRYLREYRNGNISLWTDVCIGFSLITPKDIINFYKKCFK